MGITVVVGAFALALVAMSFAFAGGAVIVALPLALIAVGIAAFVDVSRRRKNAQSIQAHREDAKTDKVDFTARDRETLFTD
jgi:hypothetical protein